MHSNNKKKKRKENRIWNIDVQQMYSYVIYF